MADKDHRVVSPDMAKKRATTGVSKTQERSTKTRRGGHLGPEPSIVLALTSVVPPATPTRVAGLAWESMQPKTARIGAYPGVERTVNSPFPAGMGRAR